MKKIFLPLLLVLFSFNSYSQFKGNPGKAKSSLDKAALKTELNEKRDLIIIAKGEIDAAMNIQLLILCQRNMLVQLIHHHQRSTLPPTYHYLLLRYRMTR